MAYELDLLLELALVHLVFYVLWLRKCVGDPKSIVSLESMGIKESLDYEEVPLEILDQQVWKLRSKEVASVKVLWGSQKVEGAT